MISVIGLSLTYKYTGAEDLRTKVYSPLNADLEKMDGAVRANNVTGLFYGTALNTLKQSGDFYRMPKSLQTEIAKVYEDAGKYEANISPIAELLEREFSKRIQLIRSEESDRQWSAETEFRLRAEEQKKPGISASAGFTFHHSGRSRGFDVRDPNHPIMSIPGGPTWEINDWLSYSEKLKQVDSLWTEDDFLYFDDRVDKWYYRITRFDLTKGHKTLTNFLDPVHDILLNDDHFKEIQTHQPDVLNQVAAVKAKIARRMDDPRSLFDLVD